MLKRCPLPRWLRNQHTLGHRLSGSTNERRGDLIAACPEKTYSAGTLKALLGCSSRIHPWETAIAFGAGAGGALLILSTFRVAASVRPGHRTPRGGHGTDARRMGPLLQLRAVAERAFWRLHADRSGSSLSPPSAAVGCRRPPPFLATGLALTSAPGLVGSKLPARIRASLTVGTPHTRKTSPGAINSCAQPRASGRS